MANQQQQQAPRNTAAHGGGSETESETGPAPGTLEWAEDLAAAAGNAYLTSVLGVTTGPWVGSAIFNWLGFGNDEETEGPSPTPEVVPPQARVRVSATRLNVRSTPDSSSSSNLLGQLSEGDEVAVVAESGDWFSIEFEGQVAWIHGGHTTPVQLTNTPTAEADTTTVTPPADGGQTADAGDSEAANNQTEEEEARPDAGVGSQDFEDRVLDIANDFNNVPVWSKGTAQTEAQAGTFQTPYVLNTVAQAAEASTIKRLRIAQGRPYAGQTVQQAASNHPFVGKGTPAQMQIVAQACIDNDLATPATIQAYVNNGRMRTATRQNGKFGVDCSGLTSQAMHDLEGNGREGFTSTNAHSFRHDGSRNQTPISPEDASSGDVISYETSNHVVVIHRGEDVDISMSGQGDGDGAQRSVRKMSVTESTASRESGTNQYVRTDRKFWYFPEATRVLGRANPSGPEWTLATSGDTEPVYQPSVANTSYSGGQDWSSDYTLNCPTDSNGTNVRVRESDGSFTMTQTVIGNGADDVELKEVSGDMVRIRHNGEDMMNGKEMWAPVRYVATAQGGYSIPTAGQPSGFAASRYSVVRNPNLPVEGQGDEADNS